MLILELFDKNGEMMQQMRQSILDIITPLVSQNVPFVTVQQVIDGLRHTKTGISIDRSMIMRLLDPDEVKSIDKIEGDRIYLRNDDGGSTREVDQQDAEKDKEQVQQTAQNQAQKELEK